MEFPQTKNFLHVCVWDSSMNVWICFFWWKTIQIFSNENFMCCSSINVSAGKKTFDFSPIKLYIKVLVEYERNNGFEWKFIDEKFTCSEWNFFFQYVLTVFSCFRSRVWENQRLESLRKLNWKISAGSLSPRTFFPIFFSCSLTFDDAITIKVVERKSWKLC